MCEFYWFEFQGTCPSGLLANSNDTQTSSPEESTIEDKTLKFKL